MNVHNLISGFSLKPGLYIWKYLIHTLLKPSLKNFDHDLDSMRKECDSTVFWTFFGISLHSVQSPSRVQLFETPWTATHQDSLSITNSQSLPKLMSIELVRSPNHLILCHPLILLPSIFPSIRVFWNESAFHIRWSKYWSFSFNISPSNEHSGLISFRMYWLYLLAVQGTLRSLLHHHSSKAAILWPSAFFILQLSHPYMTTGKTIALTRQTSVGKVTSLLFFFFLFFFLICCLGWS